MHIFSYITKYTRISLPEHSKIIRKSFCFLITITMLFLSMQIPSYGTTQIEFTEEEKKVIESSNNGNLINIGIIPNTFPLSYCSSDGKEYNGINIDLLSLLSRKTGLKFKYHRIPTEIYTPYQTLNNSEFSLVAGTIRTSNFLNDPTVILSDKLFDGSSVYIGKSNYNYSLIDENSTILIMSGYQAGIECAKKSFPTAKVDTKTTINECFNDLIDDKASLICVNKYVGSYIMQKPIYENLAILDSYTVPMESCIMSLNTPENSIIISILNKGLANISEQEYTYILMNFTIANPYKLTFSDIVYQYRLPFSIIFALIILLFIVFFNLINAKKAKNMLQYDKLTGALTQAGFELSIYKTIQTSRDTMFFVDFDISNFGGYNELRGRETCDQLLKDIVNLTKKHLNKGEHICRVYADNFIIFSQDETFEQLIGIIHEADSLIKELVVDSIIINYGIYHITDKTIPISNMISYATAAKRSIKANSEKFYAIYDQTISDDILNKTSMLSDFDSAMVKNEFVSFYQPKYDAQNKQIVGAEVLVRWIKQDGTMVMPFEFIELFEKNGKIVRIDFLMLRHVCKFQRLLIDNNITPVPISVNFSRAHFYNNDFVKKTLEIVNEYNIPTSLIEIECTETSILADLSIISTLFCELKSCGFVVAMDDFGSGYSSLNALKRLPIDIIKLDRLFLSQGECPIENLKAMEIVNCVISLAKKLNLKTVAEGVEIVEQYEFLKEIGCDTIQGYYFSKPVCENDFYKMLNDCK